jgi:hypothetical protein
MNESQSLAEASQAWPARPSLMPVLSRAFTRRWKATTALPLQLTTIASLLC